MHVTFCVETINVKKKKKKKTPVNAPPCVRAHAHAGCEKAHNDYFREQLASHACAADHDAGEEGDAEAEASSSAASSASASATAASAFMSELGWASVQMDGGIVAVTRKASLPSPASLQPASPPTGWLAGWLGLRVTRACVRVYFLTCLSRSACSRFSFAPFIASSQLTRPRSRPAPISLLFWVVLLVVFLGR